ncbi:hypothetical protein [Psychroserpens damuponensis]|uniref:hypothetical protein n=1 Tax=Psychroserpens damuponensis TaxID=943936 RepID=UPI000693C23E|nr:hypothetical protein [Psychroserpens damuponensis]
MQNNNLHPMLRLFTAFVIVALLMPIVVKSTFIFEEHHHDICIDDLTDSHFHTKDLHCELYKFTAYNNFVTFQNYNELLIQEFTQQSINSNYYFLNNHRSLSFSLRGPPRLI